MPAINSIHVVLFHILIDSSVMMITAWFKLILMLFDVHLSLQSAK